MKQSNGIYTVCLLVLAGFAGAILAATGLGSVSAANAGTMSTAPVSSAPAPSALRVNFLSGQQFTVGDLAPGDSTQWAAEVTNTGVTSGTLIIRTTALSGDILATDPVNGLQLKFDTCAERLSVTTVSAGVHAYACPVATTVLMAGQAPAAQQFSVALAAGQTIDFRALANFPVDAGNDFENTHAAIAITFAIAGSAPTPSASPSSTSSPPADGLALTGADVLGATLAAAVTFLVGLVFVVIARRRRGALVQSASDAGVSFPNGEPS